VAAIPQITDEKLESNLRAVEHAIAQQRLEGLSVSEATVVDMQRAARGEIHAEVVISNIYARFSCVPILRP